MSICITDGWIICTYFEDLFVIFGNAEYCTNEYQQKSMKIATTATVSLMTTQAAVKQ